MKKVGAIIVFLAAGGLSACGGLPQPSASDPMRITSPDGQVLLAVFVDPGGQLSYEVRLGSTAVIETSSLGVAIDTVSLGQGVDVGKVERYTVDESYPWRGVHSRAVNRCRGARIAVKHATSQSDYTVEARAYDDGVAFRFTVPGGSQLRTPDAGSSFKLPDGSVAWYHGLSGHYEAVHTRRAIGDIPSGQWAAPPLTFRLPNATGYASITESALVSYPGMALQADGQRGFAERLGHSHPVSGPFRLRFASDVDRLSVPAAITGTITTPWRVVMVGNDLNTLVNSDVVHNLAEPPDPKLFPQGIETAWLKPGRAVWRFLDGGSTSFTGMKDFSRWAGELGFEYNLLEGFWQSWPDSQLRELVDYSRSFGVDLILWHHRGPLGTPQARRNLYTRVRNAGAAGLKLDFFDHEAKEVVDLYPTFLKEAAEFQLLVDFHGANKPTGIERTWPNEMTREGIRGLESSGVSAWAPHNTTLPFTRFVAGHADYTPTVFGARRRETSWTHQITTAGVFTSPLLVYGGNPQSLLANPGVEMIKSIPSVWDETIVLPASEIGELAAFARRRGDRWFLAILNGPTARSLRVSLSFLGTGTYETLMLRDDMAEPAALRLETATAQRDQAIDVDMRGGGGFIARFTR